MRLRVRLLGLTVVDVELDTSDDKPEDKARDLSGGSLSAERVEAGETDHFMGFTNGREVDQRQASSSS